MTTFKIFIIFIATSIGFSLSAQFQLRGSTQILEQDCFQLTADSLQTFGGIISNRVIDLTEPFSLYTEIFFGINDEGGDGVAFFLQGANQFDTYEGSAFGLGMSQPSIAIEFDTHQDDDILANLNDPDFDHIAVIRDGDFNHLSVNNLQGPVNANASGNIEDGVPHNVKIEWQPESNTLSVLFDCEERINYQMDLINEIFGGNPEVFYGFTASAVQAQNQQQICVVINTLTDRLQDVVLCQGGKTQINAVRGGERYDWTPPEGLSNAMSANPVGTPTSDVTYALEIQTGYCDEVLNYEIDIEVNDIPGPREFIPEDTTLCLDQTFVIDATLDSEAGYNPTSYAWSTGLNEPIESFIRNGRFDVTVTLDDVCIVEDWLRLTFEEEGPTVDLGNDTTICQRSSRLVLKPIVAFDDLDFMWSDGSTTDSIIVSRPGAYSVQVSNDCGSDVANIMVSTEDCRNFYMPNAFSPNFDGINDVLLPFTEQEDVTQITSYKIFDRWGVQVHSVEDGTPNNPEMGWDGTYRDEPAPPGVYVYLIVLQFRDGQESLIKGDFTLFK